MYSYDVYTYFTRFCIYIILVMPIHNLYTHSYSSYIYTTLYYIYRGVVVFFRVVDGEVRKGDKVFFMNSKMEYEVSIYDMYI